MGMLSNWLHSLDGLFDSPYPDYLPPVKNEPKEVVPDHPMTYAEYKHYNDCVLIGRAFGNVIRNSHNHFQQQRWHDEMMDELRRK